MIIEPEVPISGIRLFDWLRGVTPIGARHLAGGDPCD